MISNDLLIGVDIGGTFTDVAVVKRATRRVLRAFKVPSTPEDPATAVITALDRIAADHEVVGAQVCHGTTIGTNALIERRGARTALLATAGFTDVIELRRQDRPNLYDLAVELSEPLVAPEDRFDVHERIAADGSVITELQDLEPLLDRIKASGAQSLAIALLHAYANPEHEDAIRRRVTARFPAMFVTLSSEISPEYGEYERTSTTVVNSYIGPPVQAYLARLVQQAHAMQIGQLLIVKSNGGLTSARNAMRSPAHLIESGPAAGMIATAAYARHLDRPRVIAFDMGGTTAKAGVIVDYEPAMVYEFKADALKHGNNVGGYPIRSAVLDIVEIGSGGGSIAWIDDGGVPKVGPESAGADPGPACYSRGGQRPTVTDAHAVIGTLCAYTFVGTGVVFDRELAVRAIEDYVARPLGWTVERAAYAIIQIAVANMHEMVKLATVRRGLDPRDFSIVASGGAGPLHAALVGAEIGAEETIVPPYPGMFSALGATLGRVKHDLSMSMIRPLGQLHSSSLAEGFDVLAARASNMLAHEEIGDREVVFDRKAFCRFSGQLYELPLSLGDARQALPTVTELDAQYRAAYRDEFGFDLPAATIELVKLHLAVELRERTGAEAFEPACSSADRPQPLRHQAYVTTDGEHTQIAVYSSSASVGLDTKGPLLIEHEGSTVWVRDADSVRILSNGCVRIRHRELTKEPCDGRR